MSERRLHVVFICNELPPASYGGIGTCVLTTALGLERKGHRVTIIGTYDSPCTWNHAGIEVIPIYKYVIKGGQRLFSIWHWRRIALYLKLVEINKRHRIDIVEWPDTGGLFFRHIDHVVDVLRNHGPLMSHRLLGMDNNDPLVTDALEMNTLRSIENWVGVSNWFLAEWTSIAGAQLKNSTVIYNPVNTELFKPIESGFSGRNRDQIVLYAGSLIKRKGVFQLAKAANVFLRKNRAAQLIITGRDYWGGVNEIERILDPEIRDRVNISYPVSQETLASIMRRACIFVMPSYLESFGNTWAEAMSSGLPVIGSKRSCGPEIVPDKLAGILVDPDRTDEISDAVLDLLGDNRRRKKMAKFGRALVLDKYSQELSVKKTEEFYLSCI